MLKNPRYHEDYSAFMANILDRGYAEKVPEGSLQTESRVWYLHHHGVYHPKKPDKIRVVFNCSMDFQGRFLNKELLQGPDLTNSIVGVLTRFRMGPVAFMADVESMFYQVHVPPNQRNFLRFVWWPNGNLQSDPEVYQMNVHLLGATSPPGVAIYALRQAGNASPNALVRETVNRNFYVDDCLKSVKSGAEAISLVNDLCETLSSGGFYLTKFVSNNLDVLRSIPPNLDVLRSIPPKEYSKEMARRDLDCEDLPTERALGVQWNAETDQFQINIVMKDKPITRRGIHSSVTSLYDPLGFVAPVILQAKEILQDLCRNGGVDWDKEIPEDISKNGQNGTPRYHSCMVFPLTDT